MKPKKKNDVVHPTCDMIFRKIPRVLRQHFHAWCNLRGVTMRDEIIAFMKQKIKETNL